MPPRRTTPRKAVPALVKNEVITTHKTVTILLPNLLELLNVVVPEGEVATLSVSGDDLVIAVGVKRNSLAFWRPGKSRSTLFSVSELVARFDILVPEGGTVTMAFSGALVFTVLSTETHTYTRTPIE